MTFETILNSVLGPYDHSTGRTNKFLSERSGGEYYHHHYGHYQKPKSKSKSKADKKHAILAALSLLAFLFFLNILQSCIREQTPPTGTIMMFSQSNKSPSGEIKDSEKRFVRIVEDGTQNESHGARKSRSLLQFEPIQTNRQKKFVRVLGNNANWTNELTQVSDKDLEDQKLKTLNFPLFWKNNQFAAGALNETERQKNATEKKLPVVKPLTTLLRRIKKREKATTASANESTETPSSTMLKPIQNYISPAKRPQSSIYILDKGYRNSWVYNRTQDEPVNETDSTQIEALMLVSQNATQAVDVKSTTWRPSKLELSETTTHAREYDNDRDGNAIDAKSKAATVDVDLASQESYSNYVHNYNNHRIAPLLENQAIDIVTSTATVIATPQPSVENIYSDFMNAATDPIYYTKAAPSYVVEPYHGKMKHRNKYANQPMYQHKNQRYPTYKYSPNRRNGAPEASPYHKYRDHRYPIVVAQYSDEDSGFDLMKFLWSMLTSLARPLTQLVPNFAKDSSEEPQCFDLIVCEAQRVSKYMGPTAEAIATTVGSFLVWSSTKETRQIVVDAIKSGKENTCQQQIKDCEVRSGGRSAMTVIAQILELKLVQKTT